MIRVNKFLRQWENCFRGKKSCRMITTTPVLQKPNYLFIQPPPDEDPVLTNEDVLKFFGRRKEFRVKNIAETAENQKHLLKYLPKSVDELPPRTMKDSFVSCRLPLKTDLLLRDRYQAVYRSTRVGRILEDMDVLAVYSAYMHVLNPKQRERSSHVLVTALVDSIIVRNENIQSEEDVRLSAHVSYAGKSSLEVCLIVDQKDSNGKYELKLQAIFLIVARDSVGIGPAFVNPLVGKTAEEIAYLEKATSRQGIRKSQAGEHLLQNPPNAEEREIIHNIFMKQTDNFRVKPRVSNTTNVIYMDTSKLITVFLCHAQYRNNFNKLFGGFIMRQAFELAFVNVFLYAKRKPTIVAIDDIVFLRPVQIGSFLRFQSQIGYVEKDYIHAPVYAETIDPITGEGCRTNACQFTFKIDDSPNPPPTLLFESYNEAIIYLDSRRHFKKNMGEQIRTQD